MRAQRKRWTVPCELVGLIFFKWSKIRLVSCKRSRGSLILLFLLGDRAIFWKMFPLLAVFSTISDVVLNYSNYHRKLLIRKRNICKVVCFIRNRRRAILFHSLTDCRTHFDNLRRLPISYVRVHSLLSTQTLLLKLLLILQCSECYNQPCSFFRYSVVLLSTE